MGKGTPISQELKENIADDLALGYSYGNIADRYGVSFSTIRRIKNNPPEAAQAPTETTAEEKVDTIDTSIISDTEGDVKPESQLAELEKSDVHYTRIGGQTEQPNNSRQLEQLDYEEQMRAKSPTGVHSLNHLKVRLMLNE